MKNLIVIFAAMTLLAIGTAVFAQTNVQSLSIGANAPHADKALKNATGKYIALDQAATSKGLIVMFSCNTCPFVVKSQARTKEVIKYAKENGLGMVIINSNEAQRADDDSYTAMVAYAKAQHYDVPYLVDEHSELADMFGATHTPEVFLFDGKKKLVYKGAMEDNPANPASSKQLFLKNAIDNMLASKPVDPNTTKSIGCSIKRS